ncbi:hypothetical protein FH608_008565 [Nonomuraea phyllanthi]|uniref:Uncharacterized protein n=1 Tax=Nonomuraea phyllanthi TaxID=2219224 RepID=A0A5C4WT81_9ACTN|nr:tellurite resistance/C4-dicarboxylate transporter family protein [Nonomuraea phyllanthi]KAB8196744.1 hypothetical protein FH608_008565 [Nonomuraea phyllanthi]
MAGRRRLLSPGRDPVAEAAGRWAVLSSAAKRHLHPGAFAFVMATGIVSEALDLAGARVASATLLAVAGAGFVALLLAYVWRRTWRAGEFVDGFPSLAVAAASNVLAGRILAAHHVPLAVVLLAFGAAVWLVLSYAVPFRLATGGERHQPNGTWFMWVVGTQSVAVATSVLAQLVPGPGLIVAASVCWAIGLVQYVLIAAIVLGRLLARPVAPEDLTPHYWIFMGAAAISVLAGAELLHLPESGGLVPREVVAGLSFVLWAFCSWLIPLLVALGVWRHLRHRVPLSFESGLWSMVFPIGMYGVATRELGHSTGTGWMTALGGGEVWVATAVWLLVLLAMAKATWRFLTANRPPRRPGPRPTS